MDTAQGVDYDPPQQQPPSSPPPAPPPTYEQSQPPPPPPTQSEFGQQQQQQQQPSDGLDTQTNFGPQIGQFQPHMQPPPTQYFLQPSPAVYTTQSSSDNDNFAFRAPDSVFRRLYKFISIRYQLLLDATAPHWMGRWTFSIVILLLFMIRIVVAQGWYVICYALSIYYLNLFIGFLSPKIDPAFQAGGSEFDFDDPDDSLSGPMLPTKANDEFRPFIRRLPEFKFWLSATTATLISLFMTLFEIFDLPVFWPILLLYFILLFISTMRQQISHMIKYGYVPWDKGKKKYSVRSEEPTKLFSSTI